MSVRLKTKPSKVCRLRFGALEKCRDLEDNINPRSQSKCLPPFFSQSFGFSLEQDDKRYMAKGNEMALP